MQIQSFAENRQACTPLRRTKPELDMDRLEPEILVDIVQRIDRLEWNHLRQVCRAWKELIGKSTTRLMPSTLDVDLSLNFPNLRCLDLSLYMPVPHQLIAIHATIPQLRELLNWTPCCLYELQSSHGYQCHICPCWEEWLQSEHRLPRLEISHLGPRLLSRPEIYKTLSDRKQLHLDLVTARSFWRSRTSRKQLRAVYSFDRLTELDVSSTGSHLNPFPVRWITQLDKGDLQRLRLSGDDLVDNLEDELFWQTIRQFSRLQALDIGAPCCIDGIPYLNLLTQLTSLKITQTVLDGGQLDDLTGLIGLRELIAEDSLCNERGLLSLSGTFSELIALHFCHFGDENFTLPQPLFTGLTRLRLDIISEKANLEFLSGMTGLRDLALKGSRCTGRRLANVAGLTNLTRLEAKVRCEGALGQLQTLTSLQDYVFASTSGAKPSEMEIRDLSKLAALERIDLSQVGIPYKSLVGLEHTQVSVIVYPHHEKALKSSWRLSLSEFIESSSGIAALPRSVQAALWRGHQEQILRAAGNFRSSV